VILNHVDQAPVAKLIERSEQVRVVQRLKPADRAQPTPDLIYTERGLQPLVGLGEAVQDRDVQASPLGPGEPEHLRWYTELLHALSRLSHPTQ